MENASKYAITMSICFHCVLLFVLALLWSNWSSRNAVYEEKFSNYQFISIQNCCDLCLIKSCFPATQTSFFYYLIKSNICLSHRFDDFDLWWLLNVAVRQFVWYAVSIFVCINSANFIESYDIFCIIPDYTLFLYLLLWCCFQFKT